MHIHPTEALCHIHIKHSTETRGMMGGAPYLWERGRSDLARDSWNFSAEIHPLGKEKAKPAGGHIFIFLLQQDVTSKTVNMSRKLGTSGKCCSELSSWECLSERCFLIEVLVFCLRRST